VKPRNISGQQEGAPDGAGLEPTLTGGDQGDGRVVKSRAELPVSVQTILALAMPTLIEQLFSVGIGVTDTIVAGHTGATPESRAAAAAAVGAMTYLQWLAQLTAAALGVGATAIVSRAIGAKRPRLANRVAGTACSAAFLIGLAMALIFYMFAPQLVWLFQLKGLAQEYGVVYLRIMCLTVCFQTAGQIGMACLRGAGDTLRPLMVTIAVVLMNGIASPALTFGWWGLPAWGVKGNATGTLLAFIVAGVMTALFLLSEKAGLKLRLRHFKIVPHILARVGRVALPSWVENILLWGGQTSIVLLVMGQVDDAIGVSGATLAAHNATLRIESMAFLPGFGFGIAASALVGQYLGAKKPQEAQHAAVLCNRLAVGTMTVAALPMIFFSRYLLGFMVDSEPVVATGVWPLIIAGLAQPGFAVAIIKSAALRGAGDTHSPMLSTMTGMVLRVVLVVGSMVFFARNGHANWGLIVVWVCIFLDLNYRAIFTSTVFARGKWKHKKV